MNFGMVIAIMIAIFSATIYIFADKDPPPKPAERLYVNTDKGDKYVTPEGCIIRVFLMNGGRVIVSPNCHVGIN